MPVRIGDKGFQFQLRTRTLGVPEGGWVGSEGRAAKPLPWFLTLQRMSPNTQRRRRQKKDNKSCQVTNSRADFAKAFLEPCGTLKRRRRKSTQKKRVAEGTERDLIPVLKMTCLNLLHLTKRKKSCHTERKENQDTANVQVFGSARKWGVARLPGGPCRAAFS